jgi:hypothetical protein
MFATIRWLQSVDRRVVYLLLVAVLSIPFLVTYSLPIYPDTYTRRFYDQIEKIADDPVERHKVVLVLANWGPGTSGENEPQHLIILRHLLRRRLPFVLLCSIASPEFHDSSVAGLEKAKIAEVQRARRLRQPVPTWTYGEDYLDFGFINAPVFASQARALIGMPRESFPQDFVYKRSLTDDASFPLLARFHSLRDVSAVLTISAADEGKYIAGLVQSDFPSLRIGVATMGIVANDLYPYVKSGQLFGLLNSQRAATEYRALLNPEEPTNAVDNAMSLGKGLLLLLVLLGNVAYLTTRWAERSGRLPPLDPRSIKPPMPDLPRRFMWSLFLGLLAVFLTTVAIDAVRYRNDGAVPRKYVAKPDDDPNAVPRYERYGAAQFLRDAQADAAHTPNPALQQLAQVEADQRFRKLIEQRIGDFLAAFLTLGVLAFMLGDNPFYRFVEAIIVGAATAYLISQATDVLSPAWIEPIKNALLGKAPALNLFWLLAIIPGAMWYFTYSKRYRWVNQLLVAAFIGLMIGPEFENQTTLMIPQVLDTIQPIWPWGINPATGTTEFLASRAEHLVFVLVAVLSLIYFIFFLRPRTPVGRSLTTAGRLVMMIGFGAMFGNTVNTRLSWLAPRIGFLIDDWLGKLFA